MISGLSLTRSVASIFLFVILYGYLALLCVRIGIFEGAIVIIAASAGCWLLRKRALEPFVESATGTLSEKGLGWPVLGAMCAAFFLVAPFATPEYDFGRDYGVYTLVTLHFAETGSSNFDFPEMRDAVEIYGSHILPYFSGIISGKEYDLSDDPSVMFAQFNHLTPAMRAGFVDIFGDRGFAISSGLFAALTIGIMTFLSGKTVGRWAGLVAGISLLISSSFLWNSRSTLTETPTLLFMLGAIWCASIQSRCRTSIIPGLFCVALCGMIMFSRVDGYLIIPFFSVWVVLWSLQESGNRMKALLLVGSLTGLFALSVADLFIFARPYFRDLWVGLGTLGPLVVGAAAVLLMTAVIIFATPLIRKLSQSIRVDLPSLARYALLFVSIIAVIFYSCELISSFFVDLDASSLAQGHGRVTAFMDRAPFEMLWYVPLPMILIYIGLALWTVARSDKVWLVAFATFGLVALAIFAARTVITPDHPWASRRWLSYIIPVAIFFSVFPFRNLASKGKIALAGAAAVSLVYYAIAQFQMSSPWLFQVLKSQSRADYERIASILQETSSTNYLVSRKRDAGVMSYIFGLPTFYMTKPFIDENLSLRSLDTGEICKLDFAPIFGYDHYHLFPPKLQLQDECAGPTFFSVTERSQDDPFLTWPLSASKFSGNFLEEGWSRVEDWGVWSQGERSTLILPAGNFQQDLKIVFNTRSFLRENHPNQRHEIWINGTLLAEWHIQFPESRSVQSVVIPLEMLASLDAINLEIRHLDAISPKEMGISGDGRQLALGLESITLIPANLSPEEK